MIIMGLDSGERFGGSRRKYRKCHENKQMHKQFVRAPNNSFMPS